jgi:hypothetical protein
MLTRKSQDRKKMRKIIRIRMILVSALLSGIMVLVASTAIANESQDIIEKSISNPSGPKLNLNIQGKDPLPFSNEKVLPGRTSILTAEYDDTTGQYITQKKSTVTNLTLFEPPSGCFNDASHDSSPQLMLSCVEEGFYVVGRVQATSHKEQILSHVGSPLLFPNPVLKAYTGDYPAHTLFLVYKEYPDDPILPSNLNSIRHLYNAAPDGFVKFESTTSEEEKPLGIKPLFKWLGWVCRTIFVDINEDGDIDAYGLTFVTTD